MIERDETTGMAVVEWNDDPKGEDVTWLRGVLNDPRGKRFLNYLHAWAINEAFTAIEKPNAERAAGVAYGVKKVCDTISACGLSPAKVQPPTKEEALQAALLAKAGLEHLGH